MTVIDLLDKIYCEYGYSYEKNISLVQPRAEWGRGDPEYDGAVPQKRAFPRNGRRKGDTSAGLSILEGRDTVTGKAFKLHQPTTSNVLQYKTANGTALPSDLPAQSLRSSFLHRGIRTPVASCEDLPKVKADVILLPSPIFKR